MVVGDISCFLSATTRSNINLVVIYCDILVWWREICSPIGSSPASAIASPIEGYSRQPFQSIVIYILIYCATQVWILHRNLRMLEVTTQKYDPKSSID